MSSIENYDILVIGSGEAGKYLAWTMAGEGHRTAVVEWKLIGGSCPNITCLPSKNIIHSAKVRSFTMRAAEFGVELESAVTSMKGVPARKRAAPRGDTDHDNQARAAATMASTPVSSVGWMTGAKFGEWLVGMSCATRRACLALL